MKLYWPAIWVLPLLIVALSCRQNSKPEGGAGMLTVDTHIDVPYRLTENRMEDVGNRTEEGDFDYPRAVEGGLNVAFMSIYVPATLQESGGARAFADELIDLVEGIVARHPDKFSLVTEVDQVGLDALDGKVGLALGIENGAPIEGDLANLSHFRDRGVRYITLAHSENNHICDSSYAEERQWNGLSPFGRELVAEMNRLGIMIDVSHVSDDTFFQIMELSQAPVIASHSSCRHFTPEWERNVSDEMIRMLAEKGGVIQINFGSAFLTHAAREQSSAHWAARAEFQKSDGLDDDDPALEDFERRYWEEHSRVYADLSDVVAHIDHVVNLVGIDHVGLGSDFDGVGDSLPTGLKDVSDYPNLTRALLERGYSRADVQKVLSGNLIRVWGEVDRIGNRIRNLR